MDSKAATLLADQTAERLREALDERDEARQCVADIVASDYPVRERREMEELYPWLSPLLEKAAGDP